MQPEQVTADDHGWPVAAHPWFGGAFPFCGMTLCPSADQAMLKQALGARTQESTSVFRRSDDATVA
jgi:hypothetical protein